MEEEVNDKSSNYSFILSKSKKDMKDLNEAMGGVQINENQNSPQVPLDTSFVMNDTGSINWNGKNSTTQNTGRWSYSEYNRQKEEEEEKLRQDKKKQAAVVIIDDDI